MTKKLEELFEMASAEESITDDNDLTESLLEPLPEQTKEVTETALDTLDKIENSLPQVRALETDDDDLDELSELATNSYKDLVDLGMQVDSRFSADIFNSASSMLGHAITAKTAKINKKLKQLDLQLKKATLDHKIATTKGPEELENTPLGDGKVLDRNELLKMLNKDND